MKFIAHRGNINGPNKLNENKPEYLKNAIKKGYHVELDLWVIEDMLFLGHDKPDYKIELDFLEKYKEKLYCHCKNIDSIYYLINKNVDIKFFFHDTDDCVLTSNKEIWTYPGKDLTKHSICVMPERVNSYSVEDLMICQGICTDFPLKFREILKKK